MNNCKLIKKKGAARCVVKGSKGQQLIEREINCINRGGIRGLFPIEDCSRGTLARLTYDLTGYISLRELLGAPLNKEAFISLLRQIKATLETLREQVFSEQHLYLDVELVMVNPATRRLCFLYVPIQGFNTGTNLKTFLLSIVQYAVFDSLEDTDYVREYIMILKEGVNFSAFELEGYIKKHSFSGAASAARKRICPNCRASFGYDADFCPKCGKSLSAQAVETSYDPLSEA